MSDPKSNLETQLNATPAQCRTCAQKALEAAGVGAIGAYGLVVMFTLCPPAALYSAGLCATEGVRQGYHWLHDHRHAHDAQT